MGQDHGGLGGIGGGGGGDHGGIERYKLGGYMNIKINRGISYIWESCGCGTLGKLCIVDEVGEDCNAFGKLAELRSEAVTCGVCGGVHKFELETA